MNKSLIKLVLNLLFLCFCTVSFSQSYVPGNIYYDSTNYVEYRAGNLPIIISAPHGGSLEPNSIPDRMCVGCVLEKDSWTKPIAEGMYDELLSRTGCYPHVIINLLHRKKFDANRDIGDAADGNLTVEDAWYGYHEFIESAKEQVVADYGKGIFLDIHGHAHPIQRIELGYLLSKEELKLEDSELNLPSLIQESSIKSLVSDNVQNHSHSELLRGTNSFGTLLVNMGFPSVPSISDPFPEGSDPYFSGGYNTQRHGSRDNEEKIDAIQLELNQDIRFVDSTRTSLISSLARTIIEFYDLNYESQFIGNFCKIISGTSDKNIQQSSFNIIPNPTANQFFINTDLGDLDIKVLSSIGDLVLSQKIGFKEEVDISGTKPGIYIVQLLKGGTLLATQKLVIK